MSDERIMELLEERFRLMEQVAALAADKEVLLGHMATIRNVTNDPAIASLTSVVLERMAKEQA